MEKYTAMAMFDDIFTHHRVVYLAVEAQAEIDELVDMLESACERLEDEGCQTIIYRKLIAKHKGE